LAWHSWSTGPIAAAPHADTAAAIMSIAPILNNHAPRLFWTVFGSSSVIITRQLAFRPSAHAPGLDLYVRCPRDRLSVRWQLEAPRPKSPLQAIVDLA